MTECGQRFLIDRSEFGSTSSLSGDEDEWMADIQRTFGSAYMNYGSNGHTAQLLSSQTHIHTIRFQVVIWNIEKIDVATGSVPMLFRVSLFWNDLPVNNVARRYSYQKQTSQESTDTSTPVIQQSPTPRKKKQGHHRVISYTLHGRTKATPNQHPTLDQHETATDPALAPVDIPQLSILNVASFTVIGNAEVELLDPSPHVRLFRWTCLYRATVMQESLRVDAFPHDIHSIHLDLAILTNRRAGQRWDRRFWKLGLATEQDIQSSRKSLSLPYGLVVDHVRIPEFRHAQKLQFDFVSQQNGSFDRRASFCAIPDCTLRVGLMVLRESGYYDRNIVPLLAFLNVVAATLTFCLDAEKLFFRGLLILNIAFNQMGVRLSVDKNLPSVGYEIRLQQILNHFFFVLLVLILESAIVYELFTTNRIGGDTAWRIDAVVSSAALVNNAFMTTSYYVARRKARIQYDQGVNTCHTLRNLSIANSLTSYPTDCDLV